MMRRSRVRGSVAPPTLLGSVRTDIACLITFVLCALSYATNVLAAEYDVARITKELALDSGLRPQIERRLAEQMMPGMTYGAYTIGMLNLLDYGKVVYRFDRYKLSHDVSKNDLVTDVVHFLAALVAKQEAKLIYAAALGPPGALLVDMVSIAATAAAAGRSLTELADILAIFGPCQTYQDIRDKSPFKEHEAAWEYLKREYGSTIKPWPRSVSEEERLKEKCRLAYDAFSLAQREGQVKEQLRSALLSTVAAKETNSELGTSRPDQAIRGDLPGVPTDLAGRWDGITSTGARFVWTIEETGGYESVFQQSGKEVRRRGRITVEANGSIQWRSEDRQGGMLSRIGGESGSRRLRGTIHGRKETFELMLAAAQSPAESPSAASNIPPPPTEVDLSTPVFEPSALVERWITAYRVGNMRAQAFVDLAFARGLIETQKSTPQRDWTKNREQALANREKHHGPWLKNLAELKGEYCDLSKTSTRSVFWDLMSRGDLDYHYALVHALIVDARVTYQIIESRPEKTQGGERHRVFVELQPANPSAFRCKNRPVHKAVIIFTVTDEVTREISGRKQMMVFLGERRMEATIE